jgi:uncharacterized protein (TIGR04562 family)
MDRPSYLSEHLYDWELFDVLLGGKSPLDSRSFLGNISGPEQIDEFLKAYGFNPGDMVLRSELFGVFQEALQFIRRYYLKNRQNPDGIDLQIPNEFFMMADLKELFLYATVPARSKYPEEYLWAGIILKVMNTILHADKDIRSNYFSDIQQQIFDRFYSHIHRDRNNNLFLGDVSANERIPLVDFQTKSKKTRDSIIIKLLSKAESMAELLFDRIGVRFVTFTKLDTLAVIRYLLEKNLLIIHNITPSRSRNTLIDMDAFRKRHSALIKRGIKDNLSEESFLAALQKEAEACPAPVRKNETNIHSLDEYRSIQFTCRELIKHRNVFLADFKAVRDYAKQCAPENELARRLLALDLSPLAKDIRFFYPYEVQIVDAENHKINTLGEASHQEYKRAQVRTSMLRLFRHLLDYKGIKL